MNQFIEYDRHFYNSSSTDIGESEPEDRFEYNDSLCNDDYWSLITMQDTWKVISQFYEGRMVGWDFPYRLSMHEMDRDLLDIAIEHSALSFRKSYEFVDFCHGLWLQKYDYRQPKIAAGLLRLAFKGGAKPADIRQAWAAFDIYSWDEVEKTRKWNAWLRRSYRTFLKNEGAVKYHWQWSGENRCSGEAYSLSLVIRQVLSLVIGHDQLIVERRDGGLFVRYNEVEHDEPHLWDHTWYTGEEDPQSVEAWLGDFIESAYNTGDRLSIQAIRSDGQDNGGDKKLPAVNGIAN